MRNAVRSTKIVATLGPAWSEPAQMTALLDAGVNVVRINASHATPEIRAGEEELEQYNEDVQVAWRKEADAADLAYILYQVPVMVAVHASEMLTIK